MNLIAQIISIISNPLILIPPISYALVFKTSEDASYAIKWMLISMLFASLVGLFVFWGVKRGIFSNMDISVRKERTPAFIFAGIVMSVYLLLILITSGPTILLVTLGALLLGVLVVSAINQRTKVSMHLAVFSSFALILGLLFGGIFWVLLLFAPVVAWSRVKLNKHKPFETAAGAAIGAILVIILYFVVEYILSLW